MKNDRLLEFYMLGFKNEMEYCNVPNNEMLQTAYLIGKKHSDAGDSFESTKYLTDDVIKFLIDKDI